ncbi:hypothetical protein BELL_0071g00320 [Botrytis elliptica]|uniref:Methyltransferase type 11 domain-containing protein n=1 Tax=Botrytis elliptica TaxID=278938 RepID=A0A4Z1K498_9HELO|nr:hypothetical protein EAE99_011805 [Botrytis elliptica]TGO78312.1 hypothetical protein BELL_0071g00320 [Botrytis elliptica]
MATFAHKTFSAASYAAFRPSYPQSFFTKTLNYHIGPRSTLLDLGCGHGVVSRALAPHFEKVYGTDPSAVMINQARKIASENDAEGNIEWRQASAENLDFVEDGSLDMVVAGQAAHWFDFPGVWRTVGRKLREGGTVAFWGYKDNLLVDFPEATEVLDRFCYGEGERYMGRFWEQPGRERLRGLYSDEVMRPLGDVFKDVEWGRYEPGLKGTRSGEGIREGGVVMGRRMKLGELEGYWRTFSAFHGWQRENQERKKREVGEEGNGDVIDEMFEEMLKVEPKLRGKEGEDWRNVEVETEWGTVILLARKK